MASHGQDQIQSRDPISNPLSRQGSLKNIYDDLKTIDTLDEPLKIVWTADDINQFGEGVEGESSTVLLNQQSTLSSKRTIDEPLQDMYEETTWADLFAKVAMVSDWDGGEKILGPNAADSMGTSMLPIMSTHPFQQTITVTDAMGMPQHPQCSNYQLSPMQPQSMLPVMSTHPIQQTIADAMGMPQHPQCSNYQMSPMQTQSMLPVMSTHPIQQTISDAMGMPQHPQCSNHQMSPMQTKSMLPVMSTHPIQQTVMTIGGNHMVDAAYPETQRTIRDTRTSGGKRLAPDDTITERRQKHKIQNRESAARSRERKKAYIKELEDTYSRLKEENERLKSSMELNKRLPPTEPKFQLRRTSSGS